jgi:hypothetical protein
MSHSSVTPEHSSVTPEPSSFADHLDAAADHHHAAADHLAAAADQVRDDGASALDQNQDVSGDGDRSAQGAAPVSAQARAFRWAPGSGAARSLRQATRGRR